MVNSWRKSHVALTKPSPCFYAVTTLPTPVPRLRQAQVTVASSSSICPHERELLGEPQDIHP